MNIEDFVRETLVQISRGVRYAQDISHKENGIPIAPGALNKEPSRQGDQDISFDLQVSIVTAGSGKAEASSTNLLKVIGLEASADGTFSKDKSVAQKIAFSVPMHFNASWSKE